MSLLKQIDSKLKGEPENVLTFLLFGVAVVAVVIAVYGSPTLKAAATIWMIAP